MWELSEGNPLFVEELLASLATEGTVRLPQVSFDNLAQFAQALQWVRCYQYQSCDDPNWNTTFAYHYTQRLIAELQSKIIACFATTWTYDGPRLT